MAEQNNNLENISKILAFRKEKCVPLTNEIKEEKRKIDSTIELIKKIISELNAPEVKEEPKEESVSSNIEISEEVKVEENVEVEATPSVEVSASSEPVKEEIPQQAETTTNETPVQPQKSYVNPNYVNKNAYNSNNGQRNQQFNNQNSFKKPFNNQNGQQKPFNNQNNFKSKNQSNGLSGFTKPTFTPDLPVEKKNRVENKTKDSNKRNDISEKHGLSRRDLFKKGYEYDSSLEDDSDVRVKFKAKKDKKESQEVVVKKIEEAVFTTPNIPVRTFCEKIGKPVTEVIKKFFDIGKMININMSIPFEEAELIAAEFGVTVTLKADKTAEDKLSDILKLTDNASKENLVKRPPIVTIMGHVDHGKTTLLDYIRKANVAASEAGGITQHIGAYTIDVHGERITFLDTPGHEAFTAMRQRGANVTDIAVIVVAADDNVMPQTVEAIHHAKAAGVAIIVAANKIDKTNGDLSKLKQQLADNDLLPEDWGGDTMVCPISAKFGKGVDELLDNILLLAEMLELKADKKCLAKGSIIEARLDKSVGPVATVLVQNGTLKVKDVVVAGTVIGKVRSLTDFNGKKVKEATPSYAVQIQGFSQVPNAGDILVAVKDEKLAKQVVQERLDKERAEMESANTARTLEEMFKGKTGTEKVLPIIIKADVQGSCEAVKQALIKVGEERKEDNVKVKIIHAGCGSITESDVMLADTSSAIILGFNVRPEANAKASAERSHIDIREYHIIYDAIDDINDALDGMLDPVYIEKPLGKAQILAVFNLSSGIIAGSKVIEGKIMRNTKYRLLRNNKEVASGDIETVRRNKDDVKEVGIGYECGICLSNKDFQVDDIIECFMLERQKKGSRNE